MRLQFEISIQTFDKLNRPEWTSIAERKSLKAAINKAKRESIKHNITEIDVRGFDESYELIHHSYYKNRKLVIDMCV